MAFLGQNVGAPEVGYIPTTFAAETTKFKNWIATRLQWLDTQLLVPDTYGVDENPAGLACRLFPNPTHDILAIETNITIETVNIYSYTGKLIQSVFGKQSNLLQVNVSSLKSGIYVVKMELESGMIISRKLIIE
jgi:hypothetical protein